MFKNKNYSYFPKVIVTIILVWLCGAILISILEPDFCNNGVCIGMSFEKVKKLLPSAKLFFSGEEGGIFSLEDLNGIRYEFATDGISIDCYVNQDNCTDKIQKAQLEAIII